MMMMMMMMRRRRRRRIAIHLCDDNHITISITLKELHFNFGVYIQSTP